MFTSKVLDISRRSSIHMIGYRSGAETSENLFRCSYLRREEGSKIYRLELVRYIRELSSAESRAVVVKEGRTKGLTKECKNFLSRPETISRFHVTAEKEHFPDSF